MFLALVTSWGMSRARALPAWAWGYLGGGSSTFFFAFVGVGGADDGSLAVDDDDALHVLVGLHAVEGLLHFRHSTYLKHYNSNR